MLVLNPLRRNGYEYEQKHEQSMGPMDSIECF